MLRIPANENVPDPLIRILRQHGHDVVSVKQTMRGSTDRAVLERAQAEQRLIVTFDKDFGELAVRFGLRAGCGVVLFRLAGSAPEADNARASAVLEGHTEWTGHFATVTDDRIRIRPLPRTGAP